MDSSSIEEIVKVFLTGLRNFITGIVIIALGAGAFAGFLLAISHESVWIGILFFLIIAFAWYTGYSFWSK